MNKLILLTSVAMLAFGITSESWADSTKVSCINGLREDGVTACEKCGDNCNWKIENGTLSVFGSGKMKDYYYINENGMQMPSDRPWDGYKKSISSVDIKGINYVGEHSFMNMGLTSVSFDNSVKTIGGSSFSKNNISSLSLPDSIEKIGGWSFATNNLTSVVLPDSLKTLTDAVFEDNPLSLVVIPDTVGNAILRSFGTNLETLENLRIECKGNEQSCQKIDKLLQSYAYGYIKGNFVYMDLSHRLFDIGQENCDSTNFYWNGKECIREPDLSKRKCCADVCKDMGGWCNRIRYTPAEAAPLLKDDDNTVTITFKM